MNWKVSIMNLPCFLLFSSWLSSGCVGTPQSFQQQFEQAGNMGLDTNQYTIGTKPGSSASSKSQASSDLQRLSNNYSNIPSAHALNSFIDSSLSSPAPDCEGKQGSKEWATSGLMNKGSISPAAFGARKVLATFFQSCKVLDIAIDPTVSNLQGVRKVGGKRQVYDVKRYVNSHAVLNELSHDKSYPGPGCFDATKQPPVYGYGSQKFPDKNGVVNLFTAGAGVSRSSKPVSAIDCSSFISVSLATQGLKIREGDDAFSPLTTAVYDQILDKPKSCIKSTEYTLNNTLMVGDMINVANDHIVMVDEIGDDPLGIKKHVAGNSCNRLSIEDFDFTYIHSGAVNNSYGPSRVHVSEHKGGTMFNNLRLTAVKMCKRLVKDKNLRASTAQDIPNKRFSISRHNSSNANCIDPKPVKLKNEECVKQCLQEEGWS